LRIYNVMCILAYVIWFFSFRWSFLPFNFCCALIHRNFIEYWIPKPSISIVHIRRFSIILYQRTTFNLFLRDRRRATSFSNRTQRYLLFFERGQYLILITVNKIHIKARGCSHSKIRWTANHALYISSFKNIKVWCQIL
jgi:hypothetical protein